MNFYSMEAEESDSAPSTEVPVIERSLDSTPAKGARLKSGFDWLFRRSRVSGEDLLALTHQLAATLGSGMSLGASFEVLLLPGVHRPAVHAVLKELSDQVREGRLLSDALRTRPDVFSELYVSLVQAGEATANVPESLHRLAKFQERRNRLLYDLVGALVYPLFVFIFGLLIGTGLLVYGSPIVEELYRSAGAPLPWFSQLFIDFGRGMGAIVLALLGLGVLALPLGGLLLKKESVRLVVDKKLLTWEPLATLLQQILTSQVCRTLAILYSNGIPVLSALTITGRSSRRPPIPKVFEAAAEEIKDGSKISGPFMRSPYFPSMASGMIAAGEESGYLSEMLEHVADYYENRCEFAIQSFVKFLEPLLIIVVGGFVATIVAALGIPFINLLSVLQ